MAGSNAQFVQNRGNAVVTIMIPIRSFVTTYIAARQYWATLFTTLNAGNVDLQILDVTSGDAVYLPNCSCGDITPNESDGEMGVALHYTLKFTGNTFTTIAP